MKRSHIIALVLIAVCAGIIFTVMGNTSQYSNFATCAQNPDKEFHIVGQWVKEKGMTYDPQKDPNYFSFYMKDEQGSVLKVVRYNDKPADFAQAEKVVVVGKYAGDHFEAADILMKCPSKYNSDKPVGKTASN